MRPGSRRVGPAGSGPSLLVGVGFGVLVNVGFGVFGVWALGFRKFGQNTKIGQKSVWPKSAIADLS